ncbi:uncharacterized protein BP5553_04998 [Venustampulla echinocandica]|uniref:Malate dehydrogenase n=1 Tax=Venustampulla echinocandica TaxID=2656787 RepID=A0A370TPV7_9HELO|nr:uncharacterized protein BP5553_04998 [Venustampulla echinocandica]RDL37565.1 hypothetical protein BP5553_04998 [Venustampulla echinocandica]
MPSFRRVVQGLALTTIFTMSAGSPVPPQADSANLGHCGGRPRPTVTITTTVTSGLPVATGGPSDPSDPVDPTGTTTATSASSTSASSTSAAPTGAAPALPTTGVAPELLGPDFPLLHVAIGRGVQNYTCAGAGSNSTAVGAVATLFDATELAFTDLDAVHAAVLAVIKKPQDGIPVNNNVQLQKLGDHFFDQNGVPTFNLGPEGKIFYAAKTGGAKAPANADKGPLGTGAVDWLQMKPKVPYSSETVGIGEVYRVETAGGVAPPCTEAGPISVQYAAEYWFFA